MSLPVRRPRHVRRLVIAAALLIVLFTAWYLAIRPPTRRSPPPAPASTDGQAAEQPGPLYEPSRAGAGDRQANPDRNAGVPLEVLPLPVPEPEKPAVPEPPPLPAPELAAATPPPAAAPESTAATSGATSADEALALQPRLYVHPRVPAKIVSRRKIDDAVRLQVLVGADGRVHDVRVLHAIPNCDECTQSAVEAARQFVYDPPVLAGGAATVWTRPFDMRFSYRR